MKRLVFFFIVALALTACDIDSSHNGALDGNWQLTSVDSIYSSFSRDTREDLTFWAVQKDLLEVKDIKKLVPSVFLRFNHGNDYLIVYDPVIDNRDSSDIILKDTSLLQYYYIDEVPYKLDIVKLTSSKMVLQTQKVRLNFRKY